MPGVSQSLEPVTTGLEGKLTLESTNWNWTLISGRCIVICDCRVPSLTRWRPSKLFTMHL